MKKLVIRKNDANQRIDKYLKKLLCQAPSNFIYKMIRNKDVKINGKKVNERYILQENDILEMFLYEDKFQEFTQEKDIFSLKKEFKVLYEDHHVLIVDKPAGLLVHGDAHESVNTLSNQVLSYLKEKGELELDRTSTFMPGPVHRLDRNTSGIVIFGKTLQAMQDLNEMMKKRHYFRGKVTELLSILTTMAEDMNLDIRVGWARDASSLSHRLYESQSVLSMFGIGIHRGKANGNRYIELTMADGDNSHQEE